MVDVDSFIYRMVSFQVGEMETFMERELIEELQKAIGGFLWLGNNFDNRNTDLYKTLYDAAIEDARQAYEKAEEYGRNNNNS